ncbi:MAG: alpha/beta fold hydrolase [Steroidobacter sp.]
MQQLGDVSAVTFTSSEGNTLFGTLHSPGQARANLPVIVLLSPGVKMRVGPGRLYVPLTDTLVGMGYRVFRFDFFGLGDSSGELQETMLADVYNNIEVGRYVNDTRSALQWLRQNVGAKKFILGGLCGGAITALLAAEREPEVEGLLSLGMTVTLASNAATPAKYLTRQQLDSRRQGYYRRLLQPKSWLRLLTFQSEYGVIWRSMKRLIIKEKPVAAAVPVAATAEQRGNANPLFPPAFFAFLKRGGRALMLFSEKDRLQSEYEEKFAAPFAEQLKPYQSQLHQHIVAEANHVLSFTPWQKEMVAVSRDWLQALHGAQRA